TPGESGAPENGGRAAGAAGEGPGLPEDAMPGHGVPTPDPTVWPGGPPPPAPGSPPPPPPGAPPPAAGPPPPGAPPPGSPSAAGRGGYPPPAPNEPPPAYPQNPDPPPGGGRRTARIGADLQNPRNRLGVLSVIAGLLTLVCECLPFVSIAFGVVAIV